MYSNYGHGDASAEMPGSPFLYQRCCRSYRERCAWQLLCLTLTLTVFSGCGAKAPLSEPALNSDVAVQVGHPVPAAEMPAVNPVTPKQGIDPDVPSPSVLDVMVGEDANRAYTALAGAYRQMRWTSKESVLVREYEARDAGNPFQRVVLETCQAGDAVIAVRVSGTNARLFYEAVHKKFAFRSVERTRDVSGIDLGFGPGMFFARKYADGVELTLTTLSEGATLQLESSPLRQRCEAAFVEAKRRMKAFFLEREQMRKTNRQDVL